MYLVQVRRCEATLCSGGTLTSNSRGLTIRFAFSEEWEELTKLCVFRVGENRVDVLLEGESCLIPAELLQPGRRLFVGVRGTDSDGMLVLASTFVSLGLILEGVAAGGQEAQELTPTLADRILLGADRAVQAADAAEEACRQTLAAADRLLLNRYEALLDAAVIRAEAVGNPAVLHDCAAGLPVWRLEASISENEEGVQELHLARTGKNIWDSARFLEADGWTLEADGSYSGYNSELYYSFGRSGKSLFGNTAWNEQVTVSFDLRKSEDSSTSDPFEVILHYADGSNKQLRNIGSATMQHYSVSSDAGKTVASIRLSYGSKAKIWLKNFQVEFNGADTGYQPFSREIMTFPLAEPCYGGTVAFPERIMLSAGENVLRCDEGAVRVGYRKDATLAVDRMVNA